jgi:RNA polymerase sigma-70 factor, ECF subfamily
MADRDTATTDGALWGAAEVRRKPPTSWHHDRVSEPGRLDAAVARMCEGDGDAFRLVYRAVHPTLLRYLELLVGPNDAEDVASETWSQASRDLDRFRGGGGDGFRAWVTTIGRHRALDHLRQRSRRPQVVADLTGMDPADGVDLEVRIEDVLGTAHALAMLRELPRDQAEALMLRVVMGLDAASAARILGKRPGAVRSAAQRGLRGLEQRLGSSDDRVWRRRDTFSRRGAEGVR